MQSTRWAIIDTETDGLFAPIHVVEIAAQLMEGWEPLGEPFRVLLNHNVPIPFEATAIHGYTQNFLKIHGIPPVEAHQQFQDYVRQVPLVAHNLRYDWDQCLVPEWMRLRIEPFAERGFCSMLVARRAIPETKSHRLTLLKDVFGLPESQSHRALNDVLTLLELMRRVLKPRLEAAGIDTFNAIRRFSKQTPVAGCWKLIREAALTKPLEKPLKAGYERRTSTTTPART
jgi:DNA polymerase III epsilon subunit-like protein